MQVSKAEAHEFADYMLLMIKEMMIEI